MTSHTFSKISFGFIIAVSLATTVYLLAQLHLPTKQVSRSTASAVCSDFLKQVTSDVAAVETYTVIRGAKSCLAETNKNGGTDYSLAVRVTATTTGLSSETAIRHKITGLANAIPTRNYPIRIANIPASGSQSAKICITAQRYLGSNGLDFLKGPISHYARYTPPETTDGLVSCNY